MSTTTNSATTPVEQKWLGNLVVGVIVFIILINVFNFPTIYWVYEFKGQVTSVGEEEVCIQPDKNEWSFVARLWFQKSGPICGEAEQPNLANTSFGGTSKVWASLSWRKNANGDKVKTYLIVRRVK